MSDQLGPHVEHNRHNPCPLCGGSRCVTFDDTGQTLCLRVDQGGRRTKTGIGWLHGEPNGHWTDRLFAPPPRREPPPEPDPADPGLLDRGLRFVLSRCPLSSAHRAELRRRGLTDGQIDALPVGTYPEDGPERRRIAGSLVAELGPGAFGTVPGLHDAGGGPKLTGYAGLLIGVLQRGRLVGLQVRPDDASVREEGKYRWISSGKRAGGRASGAPCAVVTGDPSLPPLVVEGILKGYVVHALTGRSVVCMAGATITADVPGHLVDLGATDAVTVLDNDRLTNEHVATAETDLHHRLDAGGFRVYRATWPTQHKGLDDALAAGFLPVLEPVGDPRGGGDGGLRRELAEAKATISGLFQTYLNPNLTANDKVGLAGAVALAQRKRDTGQVEPDGSVVLTAAEIANDWREAPAPGEHVAPLNRDGSKPRMARQQVRPIMTAAAERGILAATPRSVPRRRANGTTYKDTEWVIPPGATPAAVLGMAATWRPDEPKERKPRTIQACPHCGEVESIVRKDYCGGCGAVRATTILPVGDDGDGASPTPLVRKFIGQGGASGEPSPSGTSRYVPKIIGQGPSRPLAPDSADRIAGARADLIARTAAAMPEPPPAQALLEEADHAGDPDRLHDATGRLFQALAGDERAQGRTVPKPRPSSSTSSPPTPSGTAGDDPWTVAGWT